MINVLKKIGSLTHSKNVMKRKFSREKNLGFLAIKYFIICPSIANQKFHSQWNFLKSHKQKYNFIFANFSGTCMIVISAWRIELK